MLRVRINSTEYNYLCQSSFLNDKHKKLLLAAQKDGDEYLIEVSDDQADEIRDLCGEHLQVAGFDEHYELSSEGRILESLVDKFFYA